jgi:hypothetical protein
VAGTAVDTVLDVATGTGAAAFAPGAAAPPAGDRRGRLGRHDRTGRRQGGRVAFSAPGADTFAPSPPFAPLVAADLALPHDEGDAVALARAAGFAEVSAVRLAPPGQPRVAFVVHGRRAAR